MIELYVDKYCHNCPDFEAEVSKNIINDGDNNIFRAHTVVSCKNASHCNCIFEHFIKICDRLNDIPN